MSEDYVVEGGFEEVDTPVVEESLPEPVAEEIQSEVQAVESEDEQEEKILEEIEKPKGKSGLVRLKEKLERERQEKESLKAELEKLKAQPKVQEDHLDRTKYEDDADWIDARVEARLKQREIQTKIDKFVTAGRGKHADFLEVVQEAILPQAINEVIMDDDNSVELAYHVASDFELQRRLNALPLPKALAELGKIAATITVKEQKQAPKITHAPKAIAPIGTSKLAPPKSLDDYEVY